MLSLVCLLAISQTPSDPIVRDGYGVPHILASTAREAWMWAGYATAQDRMWQMEQSRRLARGRMAEVFGSSFIASDTEVLKTFYTDEELQKQFNDLPPKMKEAIQAYAEGINKFIAEGKLPEGFSKYDYKPVPWSPIDTVAITVRLFQQFGKGGAGEIRNLDLLGYLQSRQETKDRYLDVFDDFAWQNDHSATTTIGSKDDPLSTAHPEFGVLTRAKTINHLGLLPKFNLLELLPGVRLASNEDSKLVAEQVSSPFKWGSYAIVAGPTRSMTGHPLLLSGPQMGHRAPSVLHEMSIDAPGISVVGVDVPGVPGVIIGKTKTLTWGLTSGVADIDDIFSSRMDGTDGYMYGNEHRKLERITRTLKVKGAQDVNVSQSRTSFGPVVVSSPSAKAILSRRTSCWMREMQAAIAIYNLYEADTPAKIDAAVQVSPMSFNFFWATSSDFGFRFVGQIPVRSTDIDPRFPTPGEPQYDWKGYIPQDKMPHVINPKSGLLVNWNNKPVNWWPNLDTPVWGRIFRNSSVLEELTKPKLGEHDLEMAAWWIARKEYTYPYFKPIIDKAIEAFSQKRFIRDPGPISEAMTALKSFDGRTTDGSQGAAVYYEFLDALREELFLGTTGNFISMDNFRMATQPTVIWNALNRKTNVDYLAGRNSEAVVEAAIGKAGERLAAKFGRDLKAWRFNAPTIKWGAVTPVPYSDRGTMIQIIDLATMNGRNVVPPGISESGAHASDQIDLARGWTFKRMTNRG